MTVAFNNVPANLRTSLFFAEFNAGAAPYSGKSRQVLIGHKRAGSIAALMGSNFINIGSSNPTTLFGYGSMLADMALYARRMDPNGEIYALIVDEPTGGTAATGTITFTGPASASGNLTRYIAGEPVTIPVAAGDTATTIATRFTAAVAAGYVKFNIRMGFPVSAVAAAGVVTLTAMHTGSKGNAIRIDSALTAGDVDPTGVTVTTVAMNGGAGEVDLAAALAALGPANAEWICGPWNTPTQFSVQQDFLSDAGTGRWAPTVQKQGHYITVYDGSLTALTALGNTMNDRHKTIMGLRNVPHAPWCWAAAINGAVARSKNLGAALSEAIEIARPLQTIILEGLRPPKSTLDHWGDADRNSLYNNGIAAYKVIAGQVQLERLVTTYQTNPFGTPDITFLDLETLAISAYVGRYMRARIEGLFPRHALKDTNPRNLQGVVTPDQARRAEIHAYQELCDQGGVCDNADLFAKYLICERSSDSSRLNSFLPVQVAGQLRVFAANITIYNQLTDALVVG